MRGCSLSGDAQWVHVSVMKSEERSLGIRAACQYLISSASESEFVGEEIYVPYFWMAYESTTYEEDMSNSVTFNVRDTDRKIFPELRDAQQVMLFQDDEGRVHLA